MAAVTGILGNAISGITANQIALRNTSTNVANVNNPDYARREAVFQARSLGGVDITEIRRITNDFLTREGLAANSAYGAAAAISTLHDRLQSVYGDPSANNSLPGKLDAMFADLSELQLDPASPIRRSTAIQGIETMLEEVARVAASLQEFRLDADRQVASRVPAINELLFNIHELNQDIVVGKAQSVDVNGLIDRRQQALSELSELVEIRISEQGNGRVDVATPDGTFLVSSTLTELRYSGVAAADPDAIFPRITLHRIDAASGIPNDTGIAFEPHLSSGELRGLLNMRDVQLPEFAEELGEFSAKLIDTLNAIHNDNSAVPAPNQLVGRNTGLLATDAHGFSGTTNLSVVDASGATVVSVSVDFSANQYTVNGGVPVAFGGTLNDVVNAIDAGLGANGSASLSGGVLTIDATNAAHGVAFLQDATAPSDRAGRGFSHFFGLNDLVQAAVPNHYQTGFSVGQAHGFTGGQTMQLKLINSLGQEAIDYTLTIAGTSFNDIITQLNDPITGVGKFATFAMDANGLIAVTPQPGYEDYTLFVPNDQTNRGGTGVSLSQLFGFGPGARQNQATGLVVDPDIVADNNRLALAKLDISAVGGLALSIGDDRGALALDAAENQVQQFSAAGSLSGAPLTLSDYSAQLIASAARAAAQAESVAENREGIREEIRAQLGEISGVNLDEELANLIVFQNAYNASARLIRAAEELLDTLINII